MSVPPPFALSRVGSGQIWGGFWIAPRGPHPSFKPQYLGKLVGSREKATKHTHGQTYSFQTFVDEYSDHGGAMWVGGSSAIHDDPVTVIDEKRTYNVKAPARHPIYENFRVKTFKALLTSATSDEQLTALGGLLYQCHYSYSACGLGSDGTNRRVQLVQGMQHNKSKTDDGTSDGAKITSGGSGYWP
ncbi:unnamed protein product [Brassica rapa]|uniref:Uncharacterized protein n=1 Tax=Brassica campestris TaxID=3711 RepID=A0A3P6C5I9_BRACM|nr:unnamed protein product [Brassica rapa]VDD03752.1 unnamed protein product [Brassica rapa]